MSEPRECGSCYSEETPEEPLTTCEVCSGHYCSLCMQTATKCSDCTEVEPADLS